MKRLTMYFVWLIILVACCLQGGCAGTANGLGKLISGVGNDIQDMSAAQYTPPRNDE